MALTSYGTRIDMRSLAPRERQPLIFNSFRSLGIGESMELINDHDPRPLYDQFQVDKPDLVVWDTLENGPATWRVRITKLAGAHADGQCCGSCGAA
jgi:uncharacterized protein (DUF2249 family)